MGKEHVKFGVDLEGTVIERFSKYSDKVLIEGLQDIEPDLRENTEKKLQRFLLNQKIEEEVPLSEEEQKLNRQNNERFADYFKTFLAFEARMIDVLASEKAEKKFQKTETDPNKLFFNTNREHTHVSMNSGLETVVEVENDIEDKQENEAAEAKEEVKPKENEEAEKEDKVDQKENEKEKEVNKNEVNGKAEEKIKVDNNKEEIENKPNAPGMLSVNDEKILMAYEKSLDQKHNNIQAIRDSVVRRSASQISESEKDVILEDDEFNNQNEQALRSSFKSVAEEKEINIPELIKNQVRLEAGELSPTERMQHYQQIIRMKDADGDQYSRKLAEYRTKVAESAGKEYDKEHKDHTKLSFLNKTANAIEKIMCAMTKNPLGLVILLVAAVNAPLMMVGLLGFMAWKRKHPDMGYQKALQAQQQREIQDMRHKLATKHGVDVEKIPESEAKKALREEYVRNKANEAVYEKLEKESKKQVDKAAHAYAKDIKKQGLGKFSGKEIKEHFRRELAADPVFNLNNKRDNNLKIAMKSVKPSQKGRTL